MLSESEKHSHTTTENPKNKAKGENKKIKQMKFAMRILLRERTSHWH